MKFVECEKENGIWRVWLNRPEVRNAFHPEMISELTQIFLAAEKDNSSRVVVLAGRGKSFCAGADLSWMKSMVKFTEAENLKDSQNLFNMFHAAKCCSKPVIGVVHGHAMGGALGLVAVCDFVLAETSTKFCFSEVKLGLVPAVISSFVLEKIPYAQALRAMMSAELLTAEHMLGWGFISHVGSDMEIQKQLMELTDRLRECGPEAVRQTKRLLQNVRLQENSPEKVREMCASVIAKARVGAEGQEGLQSFFAGQKPSWAGGDS